jgi:cyclopropane-fatty-acyl-phospholipid synthase
MKTIVRLIESGIIPDKIIRMGIRSLNRQRLRMESRGSDYQRKARRESFLESLRQSHVALNTHKANVQHYEVPAEFFQKVLGKHLKYSCCYYPSGTEPITEAEEAMLRLTCERAQIKDGQDILELGCGWGSLTFWIADHYPNARIIAVSNSSSQREFIQIRAKQKGLINVEVITADMNHFSTALLFDRVVSVEMFEHMRNYEKLLRKISSWMKSEAKLFVHIFCHREHAYTFEVEGEDNWMGRLFFTGGIMPSEDLLLSFQDDVVLENQWQVNGVHYMRTAEHWLGNLDSRRNEVMPILEKIYGKESAGLWFQRWRIFFMACAELWGFSSGREWLVAHYLFRKRES